jgi:primase-like protein
MLNKIEKSYAIDKYRIREYATENIFNRHNFLDIKSSKIEYDNSKELYQSHYLHSQELIDYFKSTKNDKGDNTLANYGGTVHVDEIIIDIDNDDLGIAQADANKFLQVLLNKYEVELSHLRINFSGSKGFHIRIPAVLFCGFDPSINLCEQIKAIALKLTDGIIKIDPSIYDRTRLVRVQNTINNKSKLYAIPLSYSEIASKTIDEIKALASASRDFTSLEDDELEPVQKLVELKNELSVRSSQSVVLSSSKKLFEPKSPGNRHASLTSIVGKSIKANFDENDILQMALLWNQHNLPPKSEEEITKTVHDLIKRYGNEEGLFWKVENGRTKISSVKYIEFLNSQGFAKVYYGRTFLWIKVIDNIAEVLIPAKIGDHVQGYLTNNPDADTEEVVEQLMERVGKYFGDKLLERVNTIELKMSGEDKDTAHLYFKKEFIVLRKGQDPELKNHSELANPIWNTQIIDRAFIPINIKRRQAEFEIFVWNVSGKNVDRFLAICSAMGYLLHGFKNKSTAKAIVAVDEKISSDPNGRTGKSLVAKALSYVKSSKRIDGKNFSFNPRFTFQEISPSTEIVDFNDVKANFDFEKLFSVLTDDMTVEYKSQHPITLKFEDSPKIFISTNYTIPGNGDSYKDRMFEIEFSEHYSASNKPIDEFGHLFFDDWGEEEWNRFDNFMIECLQLYLDEGLVEYKIKNLHIRKLIDQTSQDFVDFVNGEMKSEVEYNKGDLFFEFKKFIGFETDMWGQCPVKQNTFSRWLKVYASYLGKEYIERRSNSSYLFRYI